MTELKTTRKAIYYRAYRAKRIFKKICPYCSTSVIGTGYKNCFKCRIKFASKNIIRRSKIKNTKDK